MEVGVLKLSIFLFVIEGKDRNEDIPSPPFLSEPTLSHYAHTKSMKNQTWLWIIVFICRSYAISNKE